MDAFCKLVIVIYFVLVDRYGTIDEYVKNAGDLQE